MKRFTKITALFLVLVMMFALAACSGNGSATEKSEEAKPADAPIQWKKFHTWQDEDWDAKTVAYQFTGNWDLDEYDIHYEFAINFYSDGFAIVDQRNIKEHSSYICYGHWSEEKTEDGNEITFDTEEAVDLSGGLIDHEYSYSLYEESDGGYSFGYTFALAPVQYFRTVDVVGGKAVTYQSLDAFHSAVDVAAE